MPGKDHRRREDNRRARWVRHVVLATILAVFASLLIAGPASADGWPHDSASVTHHHK